MSEQSSVPVSDTELTPALGPVRPKERIETIDILRGFALTGVLLINLRNFDFFEQVWSGAADQFALWMTGLLVEGSFWRLFSFLFGLGFALQWARAKLRGGRFIPMYARKLMVLLLLGIVHSLFYIGDILYDYAVLGFLLLFFFRRCLPKTLLISAIVCLLFYFAWQGAVAGNRYIRQADSQITKQMAREEAREEAAWRAFRQEIIHVRSQGTFREVIVAHAQIAVRRRFSLSALDTHYLWLVGGPLPLFLLGLYAGRRRIFEDLPAHLPFIRRVLWWGLGFALVSISVNVVIETQLFTDPSWPALKFFPGQGDSPWGVAELALCLVYASAIVLLVQRQAWKRRLAPLAAVGRMALTNYLLQSLIFTTILYGYGLGFYGRVGPAKEVILTFFIYMLQVLFSVWWMKRFRFGPVEWLWRTLTYGKLQPMRVSQPAACLPQAGMNFPE